MRETVGALKSCRVGRGHTLRAQQGGWLAMLVLLHAHFLKGPARPSIPSGAVYQGLPTISHNKALMEAQKLDWMSQTQQGNLMFLCPPSLKQYASKLAELLCKLLILSWNNPLLHGPLTLSFVHWPRLNYTHWMRDRKKLSGGIFAKSTLVLLSYKNLLGGWPKYVKLRIKMSVLAHHCFLWGKSWTKTQGMDYWTGQSSI